MSAIRKNGKALKGSQKETGKLAEDLKSEATGEEQIRDRRFSISAKTPICKGQETLPARSSVSRSLRWL